MALRDDGTGGGYWENYHGRGGECGGLSGAGVEISLAEFGGARDDGKDALAVVETEGVAAEGEGAAAGEENRVEGDGEEGRESGDAAVKDRGCRGQEGSAGADGESEVEVDRVAEAGFAGVDRAAEVEGDGSVAGEGNGRR